MSIDPNFFVELTASVVRRTLQKSAPIPQHASEGELYRIDRYFGHLYIAVEPLALGLSDPLRIRPRRFHHTRSPVRHRLKSLVLFVFSSLGEGERGREGTGGGGVTT